MRGAIKKLLESTYFSSALRSMQKYLLGSLSKTLMSQPVNLHWAVPLELKLSHTLLCLCIHHIYEIANYDIFGFWWCSWWISAILESEGEMLVEDSEQSGSLCIITNPENVKNIWQTVHEIHHLAIQDTSNMVGIN